MMLELSSSFTPPPGGIAAPLEGGTALVRQPKHSSYSRTAMGGSQQTAVPV